MFVTLGTDVFAEREVFRDFYRDGQIVINDRHPPGSPRYDGNSGANRFKISDAFHEIRSKMCEISSSGGEGGGISPSQLCTNDVDVEYF